MIPEAERVKPIEGWNAKAKAPYRPKFCGSRKCTQLLDHAGECDGPRPGLACHHKRCYLPAGHDAGVHGARSVPSRRYGRDRVAFVKRSPKAVGYRQGVQVRPADVHPRHLRTPST